MPGAVSTFVGRDEETARLADLVARHRMVTLVGPGGMGKTRLATEVCARIAERFPGGVRRAELAQLSPRAEIGDELAGSLGFPSLEALIVGADEAPCLLLLDNCEHLLEAVARAARRLLASTDSLHLLATSRETLGVDGEQVLVLGPLELPASSDASALDAASATRLFDDRARGAGARLGASPEELAARAELCRRLDGVPLAIELAAARARSLTAGEILALLDRRFDLLQHRAPIGQARHRSLRAAIDASYALLDAGEQRFFRALGVLPAPFPASLAHAVAGADGDELGTLDQLSRLVDRSLVVAEPVRGAMRYRLLDSLRDYAAEQARAAGEWEAASERFVAAMVAEADAIVAAGTRLWTSELLAQVLAQLDLLVAALDRCIATDADAGRAFRLALPLWAATHQGRAREVAAAGERVLARWPAGGEPLRAEATAATASALLAAGRIERARDLARAIASDAAASALARMLALRTLGIAARHANDLEAAVAHFRAGEAAAAEAGHRSFERELAVLAASTPCRGAALDRALAALDRAGADAAADGDPIGLVWARVVATQHRIDARRLDEARATLAEARATQRGFEYPYGGKVVLRLAATLEALESGWAASRPAWLDTFERCVTTGDLGELALALRAAARIAAQAGDVAAGDALLAAVPPGEHPTVLGDRAEPGPPPAPRAAGEPWHPGAALRRVRERLVAEAQAAPAAPLAPCAAAALVRSGDGWNVRFAGRSVQVRATKGLEDLAVLLARPDEEVHCLELIGGRDVGAEAGPLVDARARREYQQRIRDLQAEIDDAREANDVGRAERAEAELDAIVQQLSEAFGLGGRTRATGSAAERARSAVTWRVRAAIKRLAALDAELGRHLRNAVRTGTWCSYRPETPVAWEIHADGPQGRIS